MVGKLPLHLFNRPDPPYPCIACEPRKSGPTLVSPVDVVLVTVSSDDFVPGTLVLVDSLREHNPWFQGEAVILVDDDLAASTRSILQRLPNTRLQEVDERLAHAARNLADAVPGLSGRARRFYSLEAFRMGGLASVLFMDSDMLCVGNIQGAFSESVELAACRDGSLFRGFARARESYAAVNPGAPDALREPFNSGFMIARASVRGEAVFEELLSELHPDRWTKVRSGNTDQVALNRVFAGRCSVLPSVYNFRETAAPGIERLEGVQAADAAVIHFTGPTKPWHIRAAMQQAAKNPSRERLFQLWLDAYRRALVRYSLPTLSLEGTPW